MPKIRLLSIFLGRKGGGNHYSYEMINALSMNREIEHAFIFSNYSETKNLWETIPVEHISVDTYHNRREFIESYIRNVQFKRIQTFIKYFNPNVVYYPMSHFWKPRIDSFISSDVRVLLTIHDPILHEGEKNLLLNYFEKKANSRMDKCIVLSPIFRKIVSEKYNMKMEDVLYLPHGNYNSIVGKQGLADINQISPDIQINNYYLFTGRFVKYKGLAFFLKAVKLLNKIGRQFVVAGNGSLSKEENALLQSVDPKTLVFINRWLTDAEINALIKNAYYLVLTHTMATQSGLIPLAYTLGVPVISSDAGGLRFQVEQDKTGYLFKAGDINDFLDTIKRIDENTQTRNKLAYKVLEYSNNDLAWEKLSGNIIELANSYK
jgi:glycosyltransferase involved in cell wall biosynthesis